MKSSRSKPVWDLLGPEYYSKDHRTSRNFDDTINLRLPKLVKELNGNGLYLDVGGGKGRLHDICHRANNAIILDFSVPMMMSNSANRGKDRVQADAFEIPFKPNSFDGVFGILADPYALRRPLMEVYSVLKPGGMFVLVLPSKTWRQTLAPLLRMRDNETIFVAKTGDELKTQSFVYALKELRELLLKVGFARTRIGEWRLPKQYKFTEISAHITMPAMKLRIDPLKIPILTYALAFKRRRENYDSVLV